MTGLAAWVSNNSCFSEDQAEHEKAPWLCPSQFSEEWQCSSDDSMNPSILKILYVLSAHSCRKKPVARSTSQCRYRNFVSKTGINYRAVASNLVPAPPFCPIFPLACWLQAFPVTVQNTAHFGNTCTGIATHQVSVLVCKTSTQLQPFRTPGFPRSSFCIRQRR